MTGDGNHDRASYLMLVQGLEQMADLYKHAKNPTHPVGKLKQIYRQSGFDGLSELPMKAVRKGKSALSSHLKSRYALIRKSRYSPLTYIRLLRRRTGSKTHVRIVQTDSHKPKNKLSYPEERYFRNGKIAVYMAMFGSYDRVMEPMIQPDNIDYYLITDKPVPDDSKWKKLEPDFLVPQELNHNPVLSNRWCKMHPHLIFPEYETSIYLDSNLLVVSDLTPFVSFTDEFPIAMFRHWKRDCVYDEVQVCLEYRRDSKDHLKKHRKRLQTKGIPEHWGLLEAPVIARRHMEKQCIDLMEAWWDNYISGSRRDQLSLIETLWQFGLSPEQLGTLGKNVYQCNLIVKNSHRKIVTSLL